VRFFIVTISAAAFGKILRLKEGEEEALKKGRRRLEKRLINAFFFNNTNAHACDHKRKNAFKSPEQSHAQPEAGSASAPSTETTKKERTREQF